MQSLVSAFYFSYNRRKDIFDSVRLLVEVFKERFVLRLY